MLLHQTAVSPDSCVSPLINASELPEVAEGNRCIGLEAEILEVVGRGEVAPFTAEEDAGG